MTQNLRQVHALVLQAASPVANLRQVHALAMQSGSVSGGVGIVAGRSALQQLKADIIASGSTIGKALSASDFTLEDPVAITGTKNTSVKANSAVSENVTGSQTFRYDRKSLSAARGLFSATVDIGSGSTSVLALLTKINTLTGVAFEARDFEDTAIADGATQVTLKAASTSYIFIPGSTLSIALRSSTPSLADVIANPHLNGFTPAS